MWHGKNEINGVLGHLCAYRLNWARRTSWGWWYKWDDTELKTQDSKLEPWWSEAEHATPRPRRLSTILILYESTGKKHFVSLKFEGQSGGSSPRSPTFQAGSFNHCTRAPDLWHDRLFLGKMQHDIFSTINILPSSFNDNKFVIWCINKIFKSATYLWPAMFVFSVWPGAVIICLVMS